MKYTLRNDQNQFVGDIYQQWNQGAKNVVGVASTGFGKTVCLGHIVEQHNDAGCVIAHRQELVSQISLTLAGYGVRHRIIAADNTVRAIAKLHLQEFGQCFHNPSAPYGVASVDTLVRRDDLKSWLPRVTQWISDEGHHVVRGNKWGTAIDRFTNPNVRGLLPTATPQRADGKGLGRHADGVADCMVHAPPMRWLIDSGFLSDYRVICVESDIQLMDKEVSASGDWSTKKLRDAAAESHIVGDVVGTYLRYASNKLNVTFATDVTTAGEICAGYRLAGVRAETLTGKTDDGLRRQIIRQFANREIDVIVAVDIISEGFDLPAIECISFARPSQSLPLYMQQFGRALRVMPGKDKALVIDHVGNVLRHGLPDRVRNWTLDRRDKRSRKIDDDDIPMRVCLNCFEPYEMIHKFCPHCGAEYVPAGRSVPAMVDGDLAEMSPELLARLRGEADEAGKHPDTLRWELQKTGLPAIPIMGHVNRQDERIKRFNRLRETMALWGGKWHARGNDDSQIQRRFFHTFGVDVLSALSLPNPEVEKLIERIHTQL